MIKLLKKQIQLPCCGIYLRLFRRGLLLKKHKIQCENQLIHGRKKLENQLKDAVEGHVTENVMEIVLSLMSVLFLLDHQYRKNIQNFEASYVFTDQKNDFYVAAIFHKGTMKVQSKKVNNPTFILRFRDNETLIKLLFSGAPDILNAMLNQEVDFEGNINYINKFAYMAMHLLLNVTGGKSFAEE